MRTDKALTIAVCGGLLFGCAAPGDGESRFGWLWPFGRQASVTADGEYQRGKLAHHRGQLDDAQSAYRSALGLDPAHPEARNGMAAIAATRGDLDLAIGMLRELSQQRPAPHVHANLGHAYLLRGDLWRARDAYADAIAMDPGNLSLRARLDAIDRELEARQAPSPAKAVVISPVPASVPDGSVRLEQIAPGVFAMRYPPGPERVPMPEAIVTKAEPVQPPTPPALPLPPSSPRDALPVELVNANGLNGLARGMRELLHGDSWRVVRTSNHEVFTLKRTRIEYVDNYVPAAQRFADEIGVKPSYRVNNQQQGTRLRIVLGHDARDLGILRARLLALREQGGS